MQTIAFRIFADAFLAASTVSTNDSVAVFNWDFRKLRMSGYEALMKSPDKADPCGCPLRQKRISQPVLPEKL